MDKKRKCKSQATEQDSKDANIKVVVRCRPTNLAERKECVDNVVQVDRLHKCLLIQNQRHLNHWQPRRFTFDAVYDVQSTQTEVYESSVKAMVNHMLCGFNVTIFAYGQTGAGKTFTMEGNHIEHGILQRSFRQIFQYTEKEKRYKCIVQCSYLELYQGQIRDLLNGSRPTPFEIKCKPTLPCRGQRSVICHTIEEIEKCRKQGYKSRKTASTYYNEHSSRSHAIFTITLTLENLRTGKTIGHSKLNMVDLAGSECLQRSNASDVRLKECCDINLSLLAVNKVITSTMKGQSYIPYRDSLLTQLLQDSFGGNSKTLMIANIGPAESTYKETLTTLEYANRAKKIKNKPINLHHLRRESPRSKCKKVMEDLAQCKVKLEKAEECNQNMKTKTIRVMNDTKTLLDHMGGTIQQSHRRKYYKINNN